MALCIAGMHRSGTSMIARLLNLCGVYLGPVGEFLPANPSNPEGFWESRRFLRLNDAILHEAGGTWDQPPAVPDAWENTPGLARLRGRAVRLLRHFRKREPWGWKDPRNCLTAPLWRALAPDLKVLVCVRHPLAVAESLWARDGIPRGAALELWLAYCRGVLRAAPAADRVVTYYESYFHDPVPELRRVAGRLGLAVAEGDLTRACAAIKPGLVHYQASGRDAASLPAEVEECYRDLCAAAGRADAARLAVQEGPSLAASHARGGNPPGAITPDTPR